jgi:flagellar hook-associated protein 1 FlgK
VSGLFGTLTATSRALEAQSYGLDVTGQNIANVNTPGYARREVVLRSSSAPDNQTAGGGVNLLGVRNTRDRLLERRLQMERPSEAREGAVADSLSVVEAMIGRPGDGLDSEMNAFFDAASRLAADPTTATARQDFTMAGENLAGSFREMADRLAVARREADTNIRSSVDQINQLASKIATLNRQLSAVDTDSSQSLTLQDQQRVAVDELSRLVDCDAVGRADGGVDLTVGQGRALVLGGECVNLQLEQLPPDGFVAVVAGGQTINTDVTGGELAGYLQVRDLFIPDYQDRLDAIASQVVTEVNALHTAGYDRDGNFGDVFFTTDPAVGAASSIAVNTKIASNPDLVAAAGVQATGDNATARAISALRDGRVMDGGRSTLSDMWGQLTFRVGSDTQAAKGEQASRQAIVTQVESLSNAVSGVSLDEEAMTMLKYQRAYEANAQFFRAIDDVLSNLFQMVN